MSAIDLTTLLMVALAAVVLWVLSKKKFDSNLPLMFYLGLVVFNHFTDRGVDQYLFGGGLILAMLLRFEFLNSAFSKMLMVLEMCAVVLIAYSFLAQVRWL